MLAVQLLLKFQKITQDNMRENSFFSSEFLNKQNRIINGKVNTYADLPAPANYNGEIWLVKTTTGIVFVSRKVAGLYISNGTTWNITTPVELDSYQTVIPTPTNNNIAITDANGQTKDGGKKISDLEQIVNKDATGGYVGLTLFKINFKNVANTFTSFFTNSNTASRTYTFPNVDGTVITTGDTGTITSSMIADGAILNTDINATANISATKLQQTTIAPTKAQPANNDTLDVLANKLTGLINTGSFLAPLTIANLASGGAIGTAAATVDINSVFLINQTTTGQTITIPNPTNATLSQIITIKANSTASLIAYGRIINAGDSNSFLWNGSAWSSIGASAGNSNKPPLINFIDASAIQITATGTLASITWTAQNNAIIYRVFVKQTSLGAINIITDQPVSTVDAPTNFTTIAVNQGIAYTYAILVVKSVDVSTDVVNFTTTPVSNFILDTFDLSAGTTATLSWDSVVNATEYRIQYKRATTLSSPTIISGITGTSITITDLTPSDPDDATTPYSFKLLAYNSSGQFITETAVVTRPVFARINLRYFYDSFSNITVSSITRSADLATCTTTTSHGIKQGDVISITNSVAPFNVSFALVFDTPTTTSFRYVVANSGSVSSTGTLQKFENPFIAWNYYKFSQYLSYLETATAKILPRNPVAYTLSTSPVDYTAELIFPVAKYQNSGDSTAGWYLIKYHNSDNAIAVLADATNKNVAMQMFDGTFSFSARQDKFLVSIDDHRSYKLWHGGFAYLQNNGNDISNGSNFYRLNTDLTENSSTVYIANRPSELSTVLQAMPVRLSLSGYTVYFDNDNQRLIYQKKDGTRKTILTYASLGLTNMYGFSVNAGNGLVVISSGWYAVTNNLDTIIIANRTNTAIGSFRLIFNFTTGTIVVSAVNRITDNNLATEENCFGDQIDTYFNLRTNTVQAVRYFSGSSSILTLRLYSTPLTDLTANITDLTMTVPGVITQPGIGPVSVIVSDGSVYWIDWGHDDRGMYRITPAEADNGLGIVKMVNMSVHPRLLSII